MPESISIICVYEQRRFSEFAHLRRLSGTFVAMCFHPLGELLRSVLFAYAQITYYFTQTCYHMISYGATGIVLTRVSVP